MEICKMESCTGCFACKAVCPMNAIEKVKDKYGKTIPKVREDKCVECGLCKNVCHIRRNKEARMPQKCYAAWTKKEDEQENCASGGVATGLGRYIISRGGVVFGAGFAPGKELECVISMAETEEELENFKGSKYVQSYAGNSYRQAKEQLDRGREVLYIATPCQIAGLQGYLRRRYENLITVDLVCRGVAPVSYLQEYAKEKCPGKKIERASFRGKYDYDMCFYEMGQTEPCYRKENYLDLYYSAYQKKLTMRDNCYECRYARKERISDITIGDFWGLDRTTLLEPHDGKISEILVNTKKGKVLLKRCKTMFYLEERPVEEAVMGNSQLQTPSVPHKDYEKFQSLYLEKGFGKAVRSTTVQKMIQKHRLGATLPGRFLKKIRRILRGRNSKPKRSIDE